MNGCVILQNPFAASTDMIMWFFFCLLYYMDWFLSIEADLEPRNKPHFIIGRNLFRYCWIYLLKFSHLYAWKIFVYSFLFHTVLVEFWYWVNTCFSQWIKKHCFSLVISGKNCVELVLILFPTFDRILQRNPLGLETWFLEI